MNKNNHKKESNHVDLLNVMQAAAFLNVSMSTIRRWSQGKDLVGVKVGIRGEWRFTKKELLKMIKKSDGQPIRTI